MTVNYYASTAGAGIITCASGDVKPTAAAGFILFETDTGSIYKNVGGVWTVVGSSGGQAAVQFKDEGSDLGTSGTATTINFAGAGVSAARVGDAVTVTVAGGSGSPGGGDMEVQFNDGGAFGGDNGLTFNKTTNTLKATGIINRECAAGTDGYLVCTTVGIQNTALGFNNSGSVNAFGAPNNASYIGCLNAYPLYFLANGTTHGNVSTVGSWSLTALNNTPIGATTPSTGAFTDLSSTNTAALAGINSTGLISTTTFSASGTVSATGNIQVNGAAAGIGYATGAGGAVTQLTSKTTAVTLNRPTGTITMFTTTSIAAGGIATFVFNNSAIAANDMIVASHHSGGTVGPYLINIRATGAGTASVAVRNTSAGALAEAVVIKFAVIKSVVT